MTNLIESMNARLRKVTRNRGQFPSEQAALKVLYLAVRNLEEFRRPNVGLRSSGCKQALQAFTIYFDGRIPDPMKTATVTYTDGRTLPPSACKLVAAARSVRVISARRWAGNGHLRWPGSGTAAVLSCCTCGGIICVHWPEHWDRTVQDRCLFRSMQGLGLHIGSGMWVR